MFISTNFYPSSFIEKNFQHKIIIMGVREKGRSLIIILGVREKGRNLIIIQEHTVEQVQ